MWCRVGCRQHISVGLHSVQVFWECMILEKSTKFEQMNSMVWSQSPAAHHISHESVRRNFNLNWLGSASEIQLKPFESIQTNSEINIHAYFAFYSNVLAIWHGLQDIRHIKGNYGWQSAILNLIKLKFFKACPHLKQHIFLMVMV